MKNDSLLFVVFIFLFCVSCGTPKVVTNSVEKVVEYKTRVIKDTVKFLVPSESKSTTTTDTSSILETSFAKSVAVVSDGTLTHSLENKPVVVDIPHEYMTTDAYYITTEILTQTVEVEKPINKWNSFKINSFWFLIMSVILLLIWTLRKVIFKFIVI